MYTELLLAQRDVIRRAVEAHGGRIFGSEGDALFAAFPDARSALSAAADAQRALEDHAWPAGHPVRVRMGIHTGEATLTGGDYVGLALHQAARITSAGHGGQVLVSGTTRDLAGALRGRARPARLGRASAQGSRPGPNGSSSWSSRSWTATFPPLRTLDAGPNNLPVQLTSFIGRAELEPARRLLEANRLLTLTGPGGTGKTRLALQLAAEMVDAYPDGVFFVPLDIDHRSGPDRRRPIDRGDRHRSGLGPAARPARRPPARPTDVDRARQLRADGGRGCDPRRACSSGAPDLALIVTSRSPPPGQRRTGVPGASARAARRGTSVVTPAGSWRVEAIRLFVERAMAVRPRSSP